MNAPASSQQLQTALQPPAIGSPWPGQGGIYVGLARGQNGARDHHLIVAEPGLDAVKWRAALDWAAALEADGHKDYALPSRKEQALLFANVPELFQREWYWSNTQHASDPYSAWSQTFDTGGQVSNRKSNELRARAVRRLAIQ